MPEPERESEYASAPTTHGSALLAAGVPLSLLMDLLDPSGPDSQEILRVESVLDDLAAERRVIADLLLLEARLASDQTATGT